MYSINLVLNEKSFKKAENELLQYALRLEATEKLILQRLAEYAKHQMEVHLLESVNSETSTGELISSLSIEYGEHFARVFTENEYAKYVEFGTGIVGSNNPHPQLPNNWKYDVNSHGEKGWVYTAKDGKQYWTKGEIAHQFAYRTYLDLKQNYITLAKNVLKENGLL